MSDLPQPFRILFVCTGNTCRSPLGEALARRELERRGWTQVEVASAGTSAVPGCAASDGSVRVAAAHGLDLDGHASRVLDRDEVARADLILTMSASHLFAVEALGGGGRVDLLTRFALGEGPGSDEGVPDPFGGPDEQYVETFHALTSLVRAALDRLAPIVAP